MGRAIAVMKQHGFHEPAVVNGLSPKHPLMIEALALGIDIEKTLATAKDSGSGNTRGKQLMLQAEIRAVKTARMTKDWAAIESPDLRQRVRAIQAEKQRNHLEQEAAMLKERLRQADNGKGDWVDEREALLAQIASLEAKTVELTEESAGYTMAQTIPAEASRIQELQEQNARQADSIQSLQTQLQEAQQAHSYDSELIQQLEAKIKGWEEAFKENTTSYAALQKEFEQAEKTHSIMQETLEDDLAASRRGGEELVRREMDLKRELAGYKEANRKLKEANEHLQEQLDSADQREALPDEVQWLRSQVSVLIEKLR